MTSSAEHHQPSRVAIITGGTRGIGRGITEALADSGDFVGFILSYNTNGEAAEAFVQELNERHNNNNNKNKINVHIVGGDVSRSETRDSIFRCFDENFASSSSPFVLGAVVHNAGQYVGITADNADGLEANHGLKFGDGSLLTGKNETVNFDMMHYYQRLYGDAYVDLCERGLKRMRDGAERFGGPEMVRGSLIGISSPGCNHTQRPMPGYAMPGSGKCIMEYSTRLFAHGAASYGVNCNVIIPGVTKTDAWTHVMKKPELSKVPPASVDDRAKKVVPMGVAIEPREIGDIVVFLCGKGGGRFITGVSLPVDAGLHLGPKLR